MDVEAINFGVITTQHYSLPLEERLVLMEFVYSFQLGITVLYTKFDITSKTVIVDYITHAYILLILMGFIYAKTSTIWSQFLAIVCIKQRSFFRQEVGRRTYIIIGAKQIIIQIYTVLIVCVHSKQHTNCKVVNYPVGTFALSHS